MKAQSVANFLCFQTGIAGLLLFLLSGGLLLGQEVGLAGWFVPIGNMMSARLLHFAVRLTDGRVLIAGGRSAGNASSVLQSAEIFNPITRTFTPTRNMIAPRAGAHAALLGDGRVLIVGGHASPLAEIFDPATETFIPGGTASEAGGKGIFSLPSGKAIVVLNRHIDLYDPAQNTFTQIGIIDSDADTASLLPNGRVLITGYYSPMAYIFDSNTQTITSVVHPAATGGTTATVLKDGRVLLAGDEDFSTKQTQIFDPNTEVFSTTADMTLWRSFNTATLLPDGKVLLAGGPLTTAHSAEIYDPLTGTSQETGHITDREAHTATLLNDGTVLITGGGWLVSVFSDAILYVPTPLVPRCSPEATLSQTSVPGEGREFSLDLKIEPDCSWTIGDLPSWITLAGPSSGNGFAHFSFVASPNGAVPRNSTFSIGGALVTVLQDAASCGGTLDSGGQVFGAAGGVGTFNLDIASACPWTAQSDSAFVTITGPVAGNGNGSISFQVAANLGATRSGLITIAGKTFTVEQLGVFANNLPTVGSIPHFAAGGNWKTATTFMNTGSADATVRINYLDNSGQPTITPSFFPQVSNASGPTLGSTIERVIPAGGLLVIEASDSSNTTREGWIRVDSNGALAGFATYGFRIGTLEHEAPIPLETRVGNSYLLTFDNTFGSGLGIAITNSSGQAGQIGVGIRDDAGAQIFTSTLDLNAGTHQSFVLSSRYPVSAGKRGTIQFTAPSGVQLGVVGLRFTSLGALSGVPVIAR